MLQNYSHKTQRHIGVIDPSIQSLKLCLRLHDRKDRENQHDPTEVKRADSVQFDHSPTTREEEKAEKKKKGYIPFTEIYLPLSLSRLRPQHAVHSCLCFPSDPVQNYPISDNAC